MNKIILLFGLLFSLNIYAFPEFIDIQHLSLEATFNTFSSYVMNPDGSGDFADKEVRLTMEVNFWRYLFINPKIVSMTDEKQFRMVGLEYQAGIHLTKYFDIYYEHLSHHVLEQTSKRRFNQFDGLGFRMNLIPRKDY